MSGAHVRRMRAADAAAVASLVRQSFAADLHTYLVYCQPGVHEYLRVVVEHPLLFRQHTLLVADEDDTVVGFAEFRRLGAGRSLLSYVAVDPAHRGRGVAGRLISAYVTDLGAGRGRVELDVFRDNQVAARLYERLGFQPESESVWSVRDLSSSGDGEPLELVDAHAALAALDAYGFCRLPVRRAAQVVDAGLVSRETLRLPDVPSFLDDTLLSGIAGLVPGLRRALTIGPVAATGAGVEVLLRSRRLSTDVRSLERALA